ncbi:MULTISPECIES: DUF4307 domain-containing protein [unclassified Streptomyces]|uniref:DUF4307 domain-containing protein n=1 Tax=unclassified Streptomyces TaxID=2593676 RepID=UPI00136D34D2|nr:MULTISPECIES: DUF4307 domain-containing protein [unclassified Streptomyces]MCW5253951.1 DUF4307 domain-containing protein [Streptomyces sp. SHP 1-2]MYU25700.1 DUF4307 domain-containing protein [Streptomyces sp. SID8352]
MSTASTRTPASRYGRSSDERADRTLKIVGGVLGVALVALIGWFGYHYVGQSSISAQVVTFEISDRSVQVKLEVHKDAGVSGYCTVRSQAEDGDEVGRADFRFGKDDTRVDQTVTLRTKARGTSAELLGCQAE